MTTPPNAPVPPEGKPWTWSTTAGAPADPATDAQNTTEPLPAADPADAPVTPEPANTAETATTAGTMTPEDAEHLRVLEALERGDIDVDEALSRLDPGTSRTS